MWTAEVGCGKRYRNAIQTSSNVNNIGIKVILLVIPGLDLRGLFEKHIVPTSNSISITCWLFVHKESLSVKHHVANSKKWLRNGVHSHLWPCFCNKLECMMLDPESVQRERLEHSSSHVMFTGKQSILSRVMPTLASFDSLMVETEETTRIC